MSLSLMNKKRTPIVFSCPHLEVDWPTSFAFNSRSDGGLDISFPSNTWSVLVDYCFSTSPRVERGPTRVCYEQFKRVFCVRLFGDRPQDPLYHDLHRAYVKDPEFGYEFINHNLHLCSSSYVADLTQCGDVESNPGPVMSKLWNPRDFREVPFSRSVSVQGIISDAISMPSTITSFVSDFGTFVSRLPDKMLVEHSLIDIQSNCASLIDMVGSAINKAESQFDMQCANLTTAFSESKKLVLGFVALLLVVYALHKFSLITIVGTVVVGFIISYFGLFQNLKDCVLDNGQKFWDYISPKEVVHVRTEGFQDGIVHALFDGEHSTTIFSAIFTSLFLLAVKNSPGTKDLEDLSRKVFNYQRGMTSLATSFEKMGEFWDFLADKITARLGIERGGNAITKFSIYREVDEWMSANVALFKLGFGHDVPLEELKQRKRRLMALYNRGLDYIELRGLDRNTCMQVRQWNAKLDSKVKAISTEALDGEMRNPPMSILLYGRSGVGKSTLISALHALTSAIDEDVTGFVRTGPGDMYPRNSDVPHWDGYLGHSMTLYDDMGCRVDSESNPNPELAEIIKGKNCFPFGLPMAHIDEKGRYFTSKIICATTNISKLTDYMKSMVFPEAIVERLSDVPYIIRVKPQYRRPVSQMKLKALAEKQIHDQHYVDKKRARYIVDDSTFANKFDITWDKVSDMSRFITDEEFESIRPALPNLLPNGKVSCLNFHIYYFQPYDLETGCVTGPSIEWTEYAARIEAKYRERLSVGEDKLIQGRDLHYSTLDDIRRGVISVRTQMIHDDDFVDAPLPTIDEAIEMVLPRLDALWSIDNGHRHPDLQHFCDEYPGFEERLAARLLDRQQDPEIEILQTRWTRVMDIVKTRYDSAIQLVQSDPVLKAIKIGGCILGWVGVVYSVAKIGEKLLDRVMPQNMVDAKNHAIASIRQSVAHLPWWKRLFPEEGTIFSPVVLSKNDFPLTPSEIFAIYEIYNICVETQGSSSPDGSTKPPDRSKGRLKARVATAGFNVEQLTQKLQQDFCDVQVQGNVVDFPEHLIHPVLVAVQSCQLTSDAINHILPANTYMMDIKKVNGEWRSIGNVTFLHDRAFIMPYHYVQFLDNAENLNGTINDDSEVQFSRGCTTLELGKNQEANKMRCSLRNIRKYHRVVAPVCLDDAMSMAKDAVVVSMSGSGISGHNCANILKKFITREDLAKVCSSGLKGFLVAQRNMSSNVSHYTPLKSVSVLPCVDITPVNVLRRVANQYTRNNYTDFIGHQPLPDGKGASIDYCVTLRDRYEYESATSSGDCGAVLWVDHPQLNKCIVGMHTTTHPTQGKGCSVPLTYEDLDEALNYLGDCKVSAFVEPNLEPLTVEDVFGPKQLVPIGNFQYIGKLPAETAPMQPVNTAIRVSVVQQHLPQLKEDYKRRNGKDYPIEVLKAPAQLRITYENPESCRIFQQGNKIMYCEKDGVARECGMSDYNVWCARGGVKRDPLMEGLAKCSQKLPLISEALIDKCVEAVRQKLSVSFSAKTRDVWAQAMAQNNFFLTEDIQQQLLSERERVGLITRCLTERWSGKKILNFEPKVAAEHLLRTISLSKEHQKILWDAVAADVRGSEGLDDLLVALSVHVHNDVKQALNTDKNPMILTIQQAVSGIEGDDTIRSINAKKSPGYPYTTQRLPYGKRSWVGKDIKCDGPLWHQLENDVNQLIEQAKTGVPHVYFVDTLKDELRPKAKVQAKKTRVFAAGPMHFSIAFRMYFSRFLSFMIENRIDNESAIGINPYSLDWERLADYLNKWDGPTCIAGDYSNFDGSLMNQILERLYVIVESFYDSFGSTPEERRIRRNLWTCLTRSMHIARGGGVFRWYNSQPSGNPYTTPINVMFNAVVFRMAYCIIFGDATPEQLMEIFMEGFPFLGPPPKKTLSDFDEDVHFIAFGDDNCANINPAIIDWFNMHTITRAMSIFGLTYTDEFKSDSSDIPKARFLHEINFLKRGFARVNTMGRRWIAPLDIDTVKEIPMWVRTGDSLRVHEIMLDSIETTCLEMALHGKAAYNDWVNFLQGMKHKDILGSKFGYIRSFEEQFSLVCSEDSDLWA